MLPRDADAAYDALCDQGGLTRRQLTIWAGDRMAAGRPVFVEAGMMRLHGPLDVERFRHAFQNVVDECDALRLAFEEDRGAPCLRVRSAAVGHVALLEAPSPDGLAAIAEERVARVGVERSLYESALVRVSANEHAWVLAQHQLIADAWSFGVVFERTAWHYRRLGDGGRDPHDPGVHDAPPSFREYVERERAYRASARCVAARARWCSRFAGVPPLAGSRPGIGQVATTRTRRVARPLGPALSAAVRALAAKEAATADVGIFAVVAAVVASSVGRSTGSPVVVLNVPFANRPSARFKRTAGSFMNVWPVRLALDPRDSFRDVVSRAVAEVWETAAHQEYVGRPGPVPQPYEVFLNVHKQAIAARTFADLPMEVRWLAPTHRFGSLAVAVEDFGATRELTLVLDANAATFGSVEQERLADEMLALLAAGVAEPDRRVVGLALACPGAPTSPRESSDGDPIAGLRRLWCELLAVEAVGVEDDFFALGGDSLLAYRMLVRARAELGLDATVETFLARPTIAGLSSVRGSRATEGNGRAPEDDRAPSGTAPPIVAVPRTAGVNSFPASLAQERLWVLEGTVGTDALANVAGAFRAVGALDVRALRRAVERVAARHEALRTTFALIDGALTQIVSPHAVVSVRVVDVDGVRTLGEREAAARASATMELDRSFDVASGPLVRVVVARVDDALHVVGIALHHLVADAGSMPIFVREVIAAYRDAALPPPQLQYADFAVWQRGTRDLEPPPDRVAYWRRRLADLPTPSTHRRAGDRRPGCRVGSRRISDEVVAALRMLARRRGTTPFVTLLAVWQAVLAREVGTNDVVVLTAVDERDRPELAEVIGFFVDVVPIRARWSGDPSFEKLLSETTTATREALRWKLPFQTLLEAVECEPRLDRAPLTPLVFALERVGMDRVAVPGLELTPLALDRATTRAELALIVEEGADGSAVRLEYDGGAWDGEDARRLLDAVVVCLERVAASPDRPLSELTRPVDPRATAPVDGAATVWEQFAAQAARTPDAVALSAGQAVLTYAELHEHAERVSAALRGRGVREGEVVAAWGDRGPHLAAAILGTFRTNAVYLPLDPRWPEARVAQVLRASAARIVLVGGAPVDSSAALRGDRPAWDPSVIDAAGRRDPVPAARAVANDAAYVLYTSGSTGTPKGAVIEHAGMRNHLRAKLQLLGLGASDRVAQTAAAGFDISLWQFLTPWLVGGRTVVFDDATVRDPERLRMGVAEERVTVLELVPAVAQLVFDADVAAGEAALGGLRWLLVTGEALPPAFCRQWLARYPRVPIVNAYGPTECADDVAHHVVRTPPPPDVVRVPIGTPIDGVTLHVLDDGLRPLPPGEIGELCVGGIAVGRGYLDDPERTAAAFVTPDPTTGQPGTRLYRTGDAGRLGEDGTFECLGRRDRQVKIRGVRIELEEIEVVLRRHPSVRQAAVVTRPAVGGGSKIVACVATTAGSVGLAERLRRHVAEHLPDAMVPAAFELFVALPLGANGKVDRVALSRPREAGSAVSLVDAPEGSCLRALADAWRDVLGTDVRSPDDDFFALGGDSLSSIRVVAAARRAGFVVTPQQIFEHRTLGRIAAAAVPGGADDAEQGLVVGPVLPTPVQRAFVASGLEGLDHYNLSLLLEVDERLDESQLCIAVEHLVRQHDMLRVRWSREGGRWCQTIATVDGTIPCRRVDLSQLDDVDVGPAIAHVADAEQGTLRLATGPVLRVVWFDLGPERPARLLLVVHHLACDVVSMPVLVEDLAALCGQIRRGAPIALPAKTTSYQTWAARLAQWGRSRARAGEAAFWIEACRDRGARLPVRPAASPDVSVEALERWRATLEADETEAILAAAVADGTTVEAVLLTGLALAVTDGTGEVALALWLERHGREPVIPGCDVSRTVGWFTAIFPVRLPIAPNRQPAASLTLVHRQLCAVPAGGLGYGALRFPPEEEPGDAAATLRALPHPEISFNYLGRLDPPTGAGWRTARESSGRDVGVRGTRPTVLDVTAHVLAGRLAVEWSYDRAWLDEPIIARLAERMLDAVRALARPASAPVAAGAAMGARRGR